MTDLSKGILDINGFKIHKNTTPVEIETRLKHELRSAHKFKNGEYMFQLNNISVENREFLVTIKFAYNDHNQLRLESIYLVSTEFNKKPTSELLRDDNIWLENILGKPNLSPNREADYEYEDVYIQAIFLECDGRNWLSDKEYILIDYKQ